MTRLSLEPHNSPNVSTNLLYEYEYDTEMLKKNYIHYKSFFTYNFSCQEGFLDRVLLGSALLFANTKNHVSIKCTEMYTLV